MGGVKFRAGRWRNPGKKGRSYATSPEVKLPVKPNKPLSKKAKAAFLKAKTPIERVKALMKHGVSLKIAAGMVGLHPTEVERALNAKRK